MNLEIRVISSPHVEPSSFLDVAYEPGDYA